MGYSLRPVNKRIKCFKISHFTWQFLLRNVIGDIVGVKYCTDGCKFFFRGQGALHKSPLSNNGYKIGNKQALMINYSINNYLFLSKCVCLDENKEIDIEFNKQLRRFSVFCKRSDGFYVE